MALVFEKAMENCTILSGIVYRLLSNDSATLSFYSHLHTPSFVKVILLYLDTIY